MWDKPIVDTQPVINLPAITTEIAYADMLRPSTVPEDAVTVDSTAVPGIRSKITLRRRLEHLKCESGALVEVFDFLKFKVGLFKHETERDCGIILDEMTIIPSLVYDTSTCNPYGNVRLVGPFWSDYTQTSDHASWD
ncbi:hypothetical protein CBL_08408 [Carabus blaptoides fortunei]